MSDARIACRAAGILCLGPALAAQQPPPTPAFRAGTELVQVGVVARDSRGNPVADLRREDFQLFDNGVPQEIRLFLADPQNSAPAPPPPRAANTFTNQVAPPSDSHSGYSVILIDDLFSQSDPAGEEGSTLSRLRALQMLRSVPVGEKIAIYAPRIKLRIICEFTSDRELLERQLRKWKPTPTTPVPEPRPILQAGPAPSPALHTVQEAASFDATQRAAAGDSEMNLVADHLAGIPGRKNLIWLANQFPIGPRALQNLARAGFSIYPVDIDGVCRLCPPRPTQLMDGIAALTGGVAYYGRNDLDVAIREAMDDGRISYTLGFYQSGDQPSPLHRLVVTVARPGVQLRYRTSYQGRPALPGPALTRADLVQALNRPLDATALPVQASLTRARGRLDVEATLPVESLDLTPAPDAWTGVVEVVARFTTADGLIARDAFAQTFSLHLAPASYEAARRGGFTYHNQFRIPSGAAELKLLSANPASGKIGTLTIPLSQVKGSAANAN